MKPLTDSVKRFIDEARVCRIATAHAEGRPHVIPVCPVYDGDSTVYVDIGRKYATAKALRSNRRMAVLIDEYDEDWNRLKAVLLHCRVEDAEGEEQDRAWEMIREKFPQYKSVGWAPRWTLALRIEGWRQWGVT